LDAACQKFPILQSAVPDQARLKRVELHHHMEPELYKAIRDCILQDTIMRPLRWTIVTDVLGSKNDDGEFIGFNGTRASVGAQ
jgi:hypothetical protein